MSFYKAYIPLILAWVIAFPLYAVDVDGDPITFSFIKKWGQTYTEAKHGKMILGSYIDYLPQTAGVESISFYVCSKGYCDKSVKGVVTIQTLMPSSGGILGKLKVWPISHFIMMSIMAAISIMMFVFDFVLFYKLFPKALIKNPLHNLIL